MVFRGCQKSVKAQVPVLMLTAFQDEEYKMSAFAALADGYLEKPFSLSLLKVQWMPSLNAIMILVVFLPIGTPR